MFAMLLHDGPHGEGLLAGLLHPLTGPDHVAIALAAGLLAARLPRAARWMLIALFVPAWLLVHRGGDLAFTLGNAATTLLLALAALAVSLSASSRACSRSRAA